MYFLEVNYLWNVYVVHLIVVEMSSVVISLLGNH